VTKCCGVGRARIVSRIRRPPSSSSVLYTLVALSCGRLRPASCDLILTASYGTIRDFIPRFLPFLCRFPNPYVWTRAFQLPTFWFIAFLERAQRFRASPDGHRPHHNTLWTRVDILTTPSPTSPPPPLRWLMKPRPHPLISVCPISSRNGMFFRPRS